MIAVADLVSAAAEVTAPILAEHPQVRSAYVAGSLVQGFGNARSDVDLYLLCDAQPDAAGAHTQAVSLSDPFIHVGAVETGTSLRYDVEYWTSAQVAESLAKVSTEAFAMGTATGSDLSYFEIDLLSRLSHGRFVAGDESHFAQTVQALRDSSFHAVMASRAANHFDIRSEDVRGQLEARDLHSALISTRIAFGAAIETLLAANGDCGDSEKWRARRLRASPQDVISFDDYWQIETMQGLDASDPLPWILDVMAFAQRVLGGVNFER